jgi:drug/metabolite transporter, DME family
MNSYARPASLRGLWFVLIAAVLWGTVGATTRFIYAADDVSPLAVSLMRLAISAPILAVSCWKLLGRRMFDIQRRDLGLMALIGFLIAFYHAAYFAAITYIGIAVATLLTICVAPIIVAGLSALLKQEQITQRIVVAMVCALVGAAVLIGSQAEVELQERTLTGSLFALGSACGYAAMIVCGRFLAQRYHPLQITTIEFGAGTLTSAVLNIVAGTTLSFSPASWLLLLYLGAVTTALGYGLFLAGMRTTSGTVASTLTLAEPLTAAVIAWLLFGEQLGASGIGGALLLVFSFVILAYGQKATLRSRERVH